MTAPANKKRIHNDAARDASRRIPAGGAERSRRGRQSPYARKLEAMRTTAAIKEMIRKKEAASSTADEATMNDSTQGEEE